MSRDQHLQMALIWLGVAGAFWLLALKSCGVFD